MNRLKLLIIVDIIAFILFIVSMVSGIFLWLKIYIFSKHILTNIHNISSIILCIIIIYHIVIHWNWIKNIPNILKNE